MPIKIRKIMLPIIVILFLLEVLTLPLVLGMTYATGSETPEHILTFAERNLTWDMHTETNSSGAAVLSLFEAVYGNAKSHNDEKIIAPGTSGKSIVRLKNEDENPINFTALVYSIRTDEKLPAEVSLAGEGFSPTNNYTLPQGISKENVISAVCGTVKSGGIQDFDINWLWEFDKNSAQDYADTIFGDNAANDRAERIKAGIIIYVEDESGDIIVSSPQTGHYGVLSGYFILMLISLLLLVFLAITNPKRKNEEQ